MYFIEFSVTAEKQLYKLDKELQKRIISALERRRIRPYPYLKKLIGVPYFRLRVGDYRIIIDINAEKLLILVIDMGHRRNNYEK